jgi:hypothetical protein
MRGIFTLPGVLPVSLFLKNKRNKQAVPLPEEKLSG